MSRCLQLFALVSMFDKSRKKYAEHKRGGIEVGEVEGNMTNLEEKTLLRSLTFYQKAFKDKIETNIFFYFLWLLASENPLYYVAMGFSFSPRSCHVMFVLWQPPQE